MRRGAPQRGCSACTLTQAASGRAPRRRGPAPVCARPWPRDALTKAAAANHAPKRRRRCPRRHRRRAALRPGVAYRLGAVFPLLHRLRHARQHAAAGDGDWVAALQPDRHAAMARREQLWHRAAAGGRVLQHRSRRPAVERGAARRTGTVRRLAAPACAPQHKCDCIAVPPDHHTFAECRHGRAASTTTWR